MTEFLLHGRALVGFAVVLVLLAVVLAGGSED